MVYISSKTFMFAEKAGSRATVDVSHHRRQFLRQSSWLMIANVGGSALAWAVHLLAKKIPDREYGVFGVLLAVTMCVPNLPLQMVFAQQTARALASNREHELAGMIRLAWLGTFGLWLVAVGGVFIWHKEILERWQIVNPMALWLTLVVVLFALWLPMFWGVLQGQQNFLWLGWSNIVNAAGRLVVATFIVLVLGGWAAGMMTGVCLGFAVAVGICIWQTRGLWALTARPFDWRSLLAQIIPLMLGFGAVQFLLTADTMFVKAYFPGNQTAFYFGAGTLSRGLLWLVLPLAVVMFPKIVHSVTKSEKTDLMAWVLLGTGILAACGAVVLWITGPWLISLVYKNSYVAVASSILPWYAWAMVPLTLANVLINNLLARSDFRVVPMLVALAVGYAFALIRFHDSLVTVVKVLGIFNLLLLGVCVWFTWGVKTRTRLDNKR